MSKLILQALKSRKLLLAVLVLILLTIGAIVCIWSTAFAEVYVAFGGFLLSALGIYMGSNVTQKATQKISPTFDTEINKGE